MDGRVAWIRLALTYLILLSEGVRVVRREDDGNVVYCLRGRDVALYAVERQVEVGSYPGVYTVEVRFRESRGDQRRKRAIMQDQKR